jgi:hypothetical protein
MLGHRVFVILVYRHCSHTLFIVVRDRFYWVTDFICCVMSFTIPHFLNRLSSVWVRLLETLMVHITSWTASSSFFMRWVLEGNITRSVFHFRKIVNLWMLMDIQFGSITAGYLFMIPHKFLAAVCSALPYRPVSQSGFHGTLSRVPREIVVNK